MTCVSGHEETDGVDGDVTVAVAGEPY